MPLHSGVGLQSGYFDACPAFTSTYRRQTGVGPAGGALLASSTGLLADTFLFQNVTINNNNPTWCDGCAPPPSPPPCAGVDFGDAITLPRAAGILTRLDEAGQPVVSPRSDLSNVVVAVIGGFATNGRSIGYATNKCTGERFNASPVVGRCRLTSLRLTLG